MKIIFLMALAITKKVGELQALLVEEGEAREWVDLLLLTEIHSQARSSFAPTTQGICAVVSQQCFALKITRDCYV